MSSSSFNYRPGEQVALYAQAASVTKIIMERQRPYKLVSQALQAVISNDDIVVVPRVKVTSKGKVFHVTGNARSAKEAIDALDCPVKWGLAETPEKIPLVIQPVDCRVRPVPLDKITKGWDLFTLFPRMVSPMALFAFGAKFPDEQREAPHFTLWLDSNGQFWCAFLGVGDGKRHVYVDQDHPMAQWRDKCRLLIYE